MQGAYHGRTYGAMSVTKSKTIYSQGVGPLMVGCLFDSFNLRATRLTIM